MLFICTLHQKQIKVAKFEDSLEQIMEKTKILPDYLTLFRLGFFGRPWTGGGGRQMPPLRFFKTIKDIDMKLTPLIKCREVNLLLLSYLSCDVT